MFEISEKLTEANFWRKKMWFQNILLFVSHKEAISYYLDIASLEYANTT